MKRGKEKLYNAFLLHKRLFYITTGVRLTSVMPVKVSADPH